jgi:hypothetical protein
MRNILLNDLQALSNFLIANPHWVSGFIDGEGCFTASLFLDKDMTWGLQAQAEFNVVQNNVDKTLLEAIKIYFDNKGAVYSRPNDMSVYAVRKIIDLKQTIIPNFERYPLISNKGQELITFNHFLDEFSSRKHIGKSMECRDQYLKLIDIIKDLNAKRNNTTKLFKYQILSDWLRSLNDVPILEEKIDLKVRLDELKKS